MTATSRLRSTWTQRWQHWLERRIPPTASVELGHRDIFVFPTRWGGVFLILILLMLLTGINYQNAMVLASGFFLAALMVLHILQSYRNLAGLVIRSRSVSSPFAGEAMVAQFELEGRGRSRFGLELGWPEEAPARLDLPAQGAIPVSLEHRTQCRGWLQTGRVLVTSAWPFGLVRAWTWQDLQVGSWVYPQPEFGWPLRAGASEESADASRRNARQADGESFDLAGLRAHVTGEPQTRIAWKKLAQTGQKLVREFLPRTSAPEWVDFQAYEGLTLERRLSCMTGHLLDLHQKHCTFGLRMPDKEIPIDAGDAHLHRCLECLARHGQVVWQGQESR